MLNKNDGMHSRRGRILGGEYLFSASDFPGDVKLL
jgi:hypothetical protein